MRSLGSATVGELGIQNFKALDEVSIPLYGLGVLTGANSAGKSSALQALMLCAQSLASDRILLNGPLVRLGQPDDVIRDGSETLGFNFRVAFESDQDEANHFYVKMFLHNSADSLRISEVVVSNYQDSVVFSASDKNLNGADAANILELSSADQILHVKQFDGKRAAPRTYITFKGIAPESLVNEFKPDKFQSYFRGIKDHKLAVTEFRDFWLENPEIIQVALEERNGPSNARLRFPLWQELERMSEGDFSDLIASVSTMLERRKWNFISLTDTYWRPRPVSTSWLSGHQMEEIYWHLATFSFAVHELQGRLKYLGPLRDEPRVSSPSGSLTDFVPVGIRGEYAADLLSLRGDSICRAQLPDGSPTGDLSLSQVTSIWMNKLGLGDEVAVKDLGKLGKGLRLNLEGAERDLTMVGVGASQILPVVLLVLSANPGSIVILEQPELHLHPAVQSKLADFLLVARADLNFLVETHSEYFITRLRLRIAQEKISPDRLSLMFATRGKHGTILQHLNFNSMGSLQSWPVGFFDDQEKDNEEIIRVISERMKALRSDTSSR